MEIALERPPNFDEVIAVFPFADRPGVIFTYGRTIYNPSGVEIGPALRCHEAVHADRQGDDAEGIRAWWTRYLAEPQFRLEEELLAHRAEYRAFRGMVRDRNQVANALQFMATRLAGPLYGGLLSLAQARHYIVADIEPSKVAKIRREQREAA